MLREEQERSGVAVGSARSDGDGGAVVVRRPLGAHGRVEQEQPARPPSPAGIALAFCGLFALLLLAAALLFPGAP